MFIPRNLPYNHAVCARTAAKRISDQRAKNDNGKLNSFVLGRYYRRSEERMNFVTDVVVKATIDGRPAKFKAVTVDISLQGMQLKFTRHHSGKEVKTAVGIGLSYGACGRVCL